MVGEYGLRYKQGTIWRYYIYEIIPLLHKLLILTHQQQTAFENIVGKEEIARNEQFLLFPQCFLLNQIIVPHFSIFLTS